MANLTTYQSASASGETGFEVIEERLNKSLEQFHQDHFEMAAKFDTSTEPQTLSVFVLPKNVEAFNHQTLLAESHASISFLPFNEQTSTLEFTDESVAVLVNEAQINGDFSDHPDEYENQFHGDQSATILLRVDNGSFQGHTSFKKLLTTVAKCIETDHRLLYGYKVENDDFMPDKMDEIDLQSSLAVIDGKITAYAARFDKKREAKTNNDLDVT
jgi:hypothetical protein